VIYLFLARQPPVGQGLLIHEVYRSHTTTHHNRQDCPGRVISSSQRPLPDNKHNTHNRQTFMSPMGFGSTISAGERPQTYALDRATTGTGPNVTGMMQSRRMRQAGNLNCRDPKEHGGWIEQSRQCMSKGAFTRVPQVDQRGRINEIEFKG